MVDSNRVDIDSLDDGDESELLDALLEPAGDGLQVNNRKKPPSAFSSFFMIGGSLFSHRRSAAMARPPGTRLRGALLSWLDYGSIYCPFTKQFVSLRSPHWAHLVRTGFGIDTKLRHGRRVALVRPERVRALALSLQQGQMTPSSVTEDTEKSHPLASWSFLLRQSLGVLLETTPAGKEGIIVERVLEVLHEEDCSRTGRRIPLSFYDFTVGERYTFECTKGDRRGLPDNVDQPSLEAFMRFGESYVKQCLQWRVSVLQWRKKVETPLVYAGTPEEMSSLHYETFPPKGKVTDLINRHSSLNFSPFLVPNSRLAYLSVSYNPEIPLLDTAVNALLRTLLSEDVFYCPLEHSVDYSSLMDVKIYRLRWGEGGEVGLGEGIPVLHLGMHVGPLKDILPCAPVVVVIGNAHFLSRRAITRLLNQWTRNGVAQRAKCRDPKEVVKRKRELLLGSSDPMRAIGLGVPLFGNVCALFVGYSSYHHHEHDQQQHSVGVEQNVVTHIQWENASVRILTPSSGAMFFLEEPLVAAVRRIAPYFQDYMSEVEQKAFIEELCDATGHLIASLTKDGKVDEVAPEFINDNNSNISINSDHNDEGTLRQFYEAYEAFLTQPFVKQGGGLLSCEQLLVRFPKFAALRVRHEVLREYPLSIVVAGGFSKLSSLPSKDVSVKLRGKCPSSAESHPTVVESRHLAMKHAEVEHDALKRAYVIDRTLHRVGHKDMSCFAASSTFSVPHVRGKRQHVFEQSYEPVFEPPVLLGRWTRTLLFCAPMSADVLPLRHLLYREVVVVAEQTKTFMVLDVDAFHIDFVAYPSDRRCRLFGVRLRFDTDINTIVGFSARQAATKALQHALVKSAVEARLFPLWTHSISLSRLHNTDKDTVLDECTYSAEQGFVANFYFGELDEYLSTAQPNLVERRMFALAMAQRGVLLLTLGTQVIALQTLSPHITRGTLCRVVGFIPMDEMRLSGRQCISEMLSRSPHYSSADALLAHHYIEQQRGSTSLPVLRPMLDTGESATDAVEAIAFPTATLVGGYRSLHHYALPTVQLPLLASCQYAAASLLYHPLLAHEDNFMEFVSAKTRAKAAAKMLQRLQSPSLHTSGGVDSFIFFEDVEPTGMREVDVVEYGKKADDKNLNKTLTVQCDLLSALSLFPLIPQ